MVIEHEINNNDVAAKESNTGQESLSVDYFLDILKNEIGCFREVLNFEAAPAVSAGENYMTQLLRVRLEVALNEGSKKQVSYMAKLYPIGNVMAENIDEWKVFAKERNTYLNYLSAFERFYKNLGKDISFGAKLLANKNVDTPKEIMILEDLRLRGFANLPRQKGLDMLHCKASLEKLAQFHAASACHFIAKGAYPVSYNRCLNADSDQFKEYRVDNVNQLCEVLDKCDNLRHFIEKLKNLVEILPDQYQAVSPLDENEFNVLNHGDAWSNNIMFRHDDAGNILETIFVDYQMCRYGSPAQDLIYFIISSAALDIKINCFDYLIHYYHEKLTENLKLLNYSGKIPTLKELHISLLKHGSWGFTILVILLPIVLFEQNDDANFDNLLQDENKIIKSSMFQNQQYKKHAAEILPWLDNRGLLEYCEDS